MTHYRAVPDSPQFCQTCGVVIRVQIFRGTGYCSTLCEKEGKAVAILREQLGANPPTDSQ